MSRRQIDALQHYRPWARWLMRSRAWWLVLVVHAAVVTPAIVVAHAVGALRESWDSCIRPFGRIFRDRAAFVRGKEDQP
jgi:hypothetical protein